MNKSDLYFTVIQACKEIGLDYIDVDKKNAFGNDQELATKHYVEFGFNEGRVF